jgi:hypothetical protein
MKLAKAIEGGLAGVTTISLIGETLSKLDNNRSHGSFLNADNLRRRFKKASSKKAGKATKQFILLAGELLGSSAFLGMASLGKKRNAVMRGAALGAAAGLGSVLLRDRKNKKEGMDGHEGYPLMMGVKDPLLSKVLEVGLFAVGGVVAGKLVQSAGKKKKKKQVY